jgi:hypothetical protein
VTRTVVPTVALLAMAVTSCGGHRVEGRYAGKGQTFFESMTFDDDMTVEIVFIGLKHQRAYTVDGDKVTITAPDGQRADLTVDSNGCLTHQLLGTYCKDGGAPAPATTAAAVPDALSQTYEAQASEGRIALEFGATRKVRLTMTPKAGTDIPDRVSFDVAYAVNGDQISITLPGNEPLTLTRSGTDLTGTLNGETVRFVKR